MVLGKTSRPTQTRFTEEDEQVTSFVTNDPVVQADPTPSGFGDKVEESDSPDLSYFAALAAED